MLEFLVMAHLAASGIAYPSECCGGHDCFEISQQDVRQIGSDKWRIIDTGEIIMSRRSLDERFHRCTRGGGVKDSTTCLFIPEFST